MIYPPLDATLQQSRIASTRISHDGGMSSKDIQEEAEDHDAMQGRLEGWRPSSIHFIPSEAPSYSHPLYLLPLKTAVNPPLTTTFYHLFGHCKTELNSMSLLRLDVEMSHWHPSFTTASQWPLRLPDWLLIMPVVNAREHSNWQLHGRFSFSSALSFSLASGPTDFMVRAFRFPSLKIDVPALP